ncbi:flagellar hook-length control protein FliK [Limnohabitans sp. Rim8]|uniref:flagellar hook-length control protein FliK n=1 Tax=Limnohabitans sp. Rim8 TaxID=1100718 RepID=UPI003305ECAB
MDASLMFSAPAQPPVTPVSTHVSATSHAESPVVGKDTAQHNTQSGKKFAGLMRDLLPTHERQRVAAETAPDPSALKSETLGEELEVITAASDQADTGSLTAFALAQGLDESAVIALFGEKPAPGMPSTTSLDGVAALNAAMLNAQTINPNAQTINLNLQTALPAEAATPSVDLSPDVAWLAQNLSAEITVLVSSLGPEPITPPTVVANASTPPTLAVNASTPPTLAVNASTLTTANWLASLVTSTVTAPTQAMAQGMPSAPSTEITPSTLPLAATGVPALTSPISMGLPNVASPNAPLDTSATSSAVSAVDDLIPLSPTPQDAMRIRLVPAWESVTQQLHQMSGSAMTVAWGALTTASLGAPVRSIALDLREESATPEVNALDAIDLSTNTDNKSNSLGLDLNRSTAAGTPLPGTAQSLPGMAQTERQAHYQQLADRLGQAMAERLQSQIARGEWKLQMRLNPASLGRIDIELDMHAKGLDAMFRSENPLTRELMAQSMPKLKDTLTQSGMAVASVWVNSDAGRQSGGNPTPQREPAPHSDKQASAPADTVTKAVTKEKRTSDGFDVLA